MLSSVPIVDPKAIRAFRTAAAFETWLAANHDRKTELYLRLYKKGTDTPTVTRAEALDIALCWGWIDGISKSLDDRSFLQRFTPRRPRSIWSQINREHVARLIASGRMTPYGLAQVEAAKADGRWDAAYPSPSQMTIPDDLLVAVKQNSEALTAFRTLNRQNLYALGFRLWNTKTAAGRARKVAALVDMLARGETIVPNGKPRPPSRPPTLVKQGDSRKANTTAKTKTKTKTEGRVGPAAKK